MRKTTILAIAYLPYYLNDFANIFVTGYPAWLAVDYGQRFLILGFLFFMFARGELTKADLGLVSVPIRRFVLWTVGTVAVSMAYLYLSEFVLAPYFPKGALGGVPIDMDSPLFLLDVTFGLVLVGFSEEIVCRGLTLSTLKGKIPTPVVYLVSALLFSLMHWSLSAHTLTDAFVYGLVFVPATLATGSIWPAAVTHFLVNFVLYSL